MNEVDNYIQQQDKTEQSAAQQSGFPYKKSQGILDELQSQNVPSKNVPSKKSKKHSGLLTIPD